MSHVIVVPVTLTCVTDVDVCVRDLFIASDVTFEPRAKVQSRQSFARVAAAKVLVTRFLRNEFAFINPDVLKVLA